MTTVNFTVVPSQWRMWAVQWLMWTGLTCPLASTRLFFVISTVNTHSSRQTLCLKRPYCEKTDFFFSISCLFFHHHRQLPHQLHSLMFFLDCTSFKVSNVFSLSSVQGNVTVTDCILVLRAGPPSCLFLEIHSSESQQRATKLCYISSSSSANTVAFSGGPRLRVYGGWASASPRLPWLINHKLQSELLTTLSMLRSHIMQYTWYTLLIMARRHCEGLVWAPPKLPVMFYAWRRAAARCVFLRGGAARTSRSDLAAVRCGAGSAESVDLVSLPTPSALLSFTANRCLKSEPPLTVPRRPLENHVHIRENF